MQLLLILILILLFSLLEKQISYILEWLSSCEYFPLIFTLLWLSLIFLYFFKLPFSKKAISKFNPFLKSLIGICENYELSDFQKYNRFYALISTSTTYERLTSKFILRNLRPQKTSYNLKANNTIFSIISIILTSIISYIFTNLKDFTFRINLPSDKSLLLASIICIILVLLFFIIVIFKIPYKRKIQKKVNYLLHIIELLESDLDTLNETRKARSEN